jgi:hypothetical protein|tara:strand:- start:128 stop:1114 length:987 start_codon:yes stop_codon:yes gene_type:complete
MKKYVVITTIFEPSDAVKLIADLPDVDLIIVGDKKTPEDWHCKGAEYFSVDRQVELGFELSHILPFNHYCRKMIGYLVAAKDGAAMIIDTDDDNLPKPNWGFPPFGEAYQAIAPNHGFVNIYQWYTRQMIWPRGIPLDLIKTSFDLRSLSAERICNVGIWQGLADDDPDVDAIYRLTSDEACNFDSAEPVVLSKGTVCPFNSQNTAIRKELFALLYLPTSVTFRFTDILRGLVAQPIMWAAGYELGFTEATVVQERNPHDLMKDFVSEVPMYLRGHDVVDIVSQALVPDDSVENNLRRAYAALLVEDIVSKSEILTLDAWLTDLSAIS